MSIWVGHRYTDAGLQNRLARFFVKPPWTPSKGVDFGIELLVTIDDGLRFGHEQAFAVEQEYPASSLVESRALRAVKEHDTASIVPYTNMKTPKSIEAEHPEDLLLRAAQNQHQLRTRAAMEHSTGLVTVDPGKILAQSSRSPSVWSFFRKRRTSILSSVTPFTPGGTPFDSIEAEVDRTYRKNKMSQWSDDLDESCLGIIRDSYKDIVRTNQKIKRRSDWVMLPQVEVEDAEA